MLEIGLQIVVATLLVVTIVYAVILNRRLGRLRDGREEMQRLVAELSATMAGTERSIAALRESAVGDDAALGRRITEARAVRDEIGFLVECAETLAERLDAQIGAGRNVAMAVPATDADQPAADSGDEELFAAETIHEPDTRTAGTARATATAWLRGRPRNVASGDAAVTAASGLR